MTNFRIQTLEEIGFKWSYSSAIWEVRLSELTDYRKIQGHCNVRTHYSENIKLAKWVNNQRCQYRFHLEGKPSSMTNFRIQALESLGLKWSVRVTATWEVRLNELADYRKIQGHCNVPTHYSENIELAHWVAKQRRDYRLHVKGTTSPMTLSRIQALESLGFKWSVLVTAAREDRLSELADYRKIHGHCNVPQHYIKNTNLACWVTTQRRQYTLRVDGKPSYMTLPRIQELESLGFEWKPSISRRTGNRKKASVEDDTTSVRERAVEVPDHVQTTAQTQKDFSGREIRSSKQVDGAFVSGVSDWNGEAHLSYIPGRTEEI
jgi:hypothetical protein